MKLTKENLSEAISKSIDNAGDLIDEGKLLEDNGKFARAYTLYQLAIEEVGKASLAFDLLLFGNIEDEVSQKQFLKEFRDHKVKTKKSMGIDYAIAFTIKNPKVSKVLLSNARKQDDDIEEINNRKNYSLYTSIIDGKFVVPSEVITSNMVDDLGLYARMRHIATKQFLDASIKNFDSLKEHIGKMDADELTKEAMKFLADLLNE